MEQWEQNYYISSIAGASNGSSLVVMSKGLLERVSFALVPLKSLIHTVLITMLFFVAQITSNKIF